MTRFRAYASDSEDESSSSSSDDLVIEEKGIATRLQGNGVQDDSDSEDSVEELYMDLEAAEGHDKSVSPPPVPTRLADATLIPRAREVGVDRQKMHVMQASLFRQPEETATIAALSQQPTSRKRLLLPNAITRKHSRDSEGEGLRADSRQRASFAHDIDPAPFRPSRKYARVESAASAVSGHEGLLVDAGLSMGRSFRVGWGPGGRLIHVGSICAPWSTPVSSANSSVVTVTTVPTVTPPVAEASDKASKLLSHNLTNTPIEMDADGVPCAVPSPYLTFASFQSLFPETDNSFEASLFRLGHALFDPLDLRLGPSVSDDVRRRVETLRRKTALSRWLQNAVSPTIEAELSEIMADEHAWARTVFSLLTGNQIEKACDVALDASNVKLATLLSQAGGDAEFKIDLRAQLALWREQKIDVHIDVNIRKIYALLAGIVDVLEGSKGLGLERCPDVPLAKGLDWKRAFGLHLWHGQSLDSAIADAVDSYDRLVQEHVSDVAPPTPWYRESPSATQSVWKLPPEIEPPDALFSLIKLFANPAYTLSDILKPFSFSPSPSDYRLPWHLYILLSRCLRIRDFADRGDAGVDGRRGEEDSESDGGVEGHSPSADLLASSYALQLEETGMIQEAVFVLLHLEGSPGRKRAIKDMLARNASKLDDWMMRGLVGSLKIPMAWVNEAKAIHALNNGKVYQAYELYLMAGKYSAAHELAVYELAPEAIMRKDLELLEELFQRISGHPVDGWEVRGKLFLDYVDAMNRLPELRERLDNIAMTATEATDASEVEELTRNVPKLMDMLPAVYHERSDIRQKAALAEMISGLTAGVDQLRPLALGSQLRTAKAPEATRLGHIRAVAYEKFLRNIEVA